MEELLKKGNLIFFGGKGGTGKTTCSAATAYHAAKKGLKTIIISVDDKEHSLGNSFDIDIESGKPIKIDGVSNLFVYEMSATKLFEQWSTQNKDVQEFFKMFSGGDDKMSYLAGSSEILGLSEIYKLANSGEYDLVVVDTAPTASALGLLETVRGMEQVIGNKKFRTLVKKGISVAKTAKAGYDGINKITGFLKKPFESQEAKEDRELNEMLGNKIQQGLDALNFDKIEKYLDDFESQVTDVREMLEDPNHTMFNIVGNPEQMSVNESASLYRRLVDINMPVKNLIFNRVTEKDKAIDAHYVEDNKGHKFFRYYEFFEKQAESQQFYMDFANGLINSTHEPDTGGRAYLKEIVSEHKTEMSRLTAKGKKPDKVDIVRVPRFWKDVHGKEALEEVEKYLFKA